MTPTLSVVTPVYNGAGYLPGCLGSVTAALAAAAPADRAAVEYVVCDNHSTDGTAALAHAATVDCGAYRVVAPPEHYANRTRNWNHGLRAAGGDWLAMLHADDLLAPDGVRNVLAACRAAPADAVLVWGRHRVFTDPAAPGPLRPRWPAPARLAGPALVRSVLASHCCFLPFLAVRRTAFEAAGGFDDRFELVQDWDLWLRLLATGGSVWYAGSEFFWWRDHPTSAWYARRMAEEHLLLAGRLGRVAPALTPAEREAASTVLLARATNWLPADDPLGSLWSKVEDGCEVDLTFTDRAGAKAILAAAHKRIGRRLAGRLARGAVGALVGRAW